MSDKPRSPLHLSDPARRHFMAIAAAGAGRLSAIAASSTLLAACNIEDISQSQQHHCFGRGTHILTADGEVSVEDLAAGDRVVTTSGDLPVRWIGRRVIRRGGSASWHPSVLPIRVSRFAIDDQTPHRDLYLSPEHSLFIDGALVPVKYLVNGHSIVRDNDASRSETIEYFCVKLDTHEVVFAEGAAAETFLYTAGQIVWDNLGEYEDVYGTEHAAMKAFAPVYRYSGGYAEARGLLRLAASRFVDVRDPIQVAYDRLAARAASIAA